VALDDATKLCQGKSKNQVAAIACQGHLCEGSQRFSPADIEMASMHNHEDQELPCDFSKFHRATGGFMRFIWGKGLVSPWSAVQIQPLPLFVA